MELFERLEGRLSRNDQTDIASRLQSDNFQCVGNIADTKQRKRGAKGKAALEAIVKAGAELLAERGYEGLTVQAIAGRLGISEGTPYQYFSNKAAIASAIIDRWGDGFIELFETALADSASQTLADASRAIVAAHLMAERDSVASLPAVYELAPRLGLADHVKRVAQQSENLIEMRLRSHSNEIDDKIDLATAAVSIELQLSGLAIRRSLRPAEAPRLATSIATSITRQLQRRG